MIKKLAAVTVSILTGCSSTSSTELFFYNKTRVVEWRKVNNVDAYCRARMAKPDPRVVYGGCADYQREDKCVIYTGPTENLELLGHELKHCFVGNFHS